MWGESKSIVIIDDSIDFCTMGRKTLLSNGYQGLIKCWPHARGFYENTTQMPDLVICDLCMPGHSGLQVYDRLQDNGFKGEFILCSGDYGMLDHSSLDMDYLLKPIDIQKFLEKVKECLS